MAFQSIDNYVTDYKGILLSPFTISSQSVPDGTDVRMNSILSVMANTTALGKGITNKNKITWRYLIDSFGLGLLQVLNRFSRYLWSKT